MSSVSGAHYDETDLPRQPAGDHSTAAALSELELMKKSQLGDRGAYGKLVLLYQHRLFNAICRMVGDRDEARDLAQETFTRGLDKIDGFRGDASPYTWLFRIATNLSISRLRKTQRRRTFSLDRPAGENTSHGDGGDDQASALLDRISAQRAGEQAQPQMDLERQERNSKVLEALGRLDAEYRAVLVMRDIEGFDYQQMADVLGLPLGTLKSRLFRARLALRDELKSYLQ
jgi:RNA polymerase sigma-70 factor (ECF subfamily)